MTRELKLALIVGFALVLVVTVLISDHLSHARQAELAGNIPAEPNKVAEPPAITMGNDIAPAPTPQAPLTNNTLAGNAPAPGATPTTSGLGITDPAGPLTIARTPEGPAPTVINQGHGTPSNSTSEHSDLLRDVAKLDGTIRGDMIILPPPAFRTSTQPMPGPLTPNTTSPVVPVPSPLSTTPDRMYTVVAGDSTFKIAKQFYGDGKVWRKLVKYNKLDEEGQLKIGTQLKIPSSEVLLGKKSSTTLTALPMSPVGPGSTVHTNTGVTVYSPGTHTNPVTTVTPIKSHTYTVKKGDTLAQIAQRELGTSKRAHEIADLNKKTIKDPDNVPLGAVLTLPSA